MLGKLLGTECPPLDLGKKQAKPEHYTTWKISKFSFKMEKSRHEGKQCYLFPKFM